MTLKTSALSLAAASLLTVPLAHAVTFSFSGELTESDPTYNRVSALGDALSTTGTDVHYDTYTLGFGENTVATVGVFATGGLLLMESAATPVAATHDQPFFDAFLSIYQGSFNPAQPLNNLVAFNDDDNFFFAPDELDAVVYNFDFTGGQDYILVVSSFANGEVGPYDVMIQTGLVPIPEPETYALFAGAGLIGFGVWRRSRKA
jgi:hypothetical protein